MPFNPLYDIEENFPNYAAAVGAGEALIAPDSVIRAAQDRVMMRRYIRRKEPTLAGYGLREMDGAALAALVAVIDGAHA